VDKYQPGASIAGREWTLVGTEGGYVLQGANSLWSPSYPTGSSNESDNGWLAYQCDTSLSSSGWFWHGGAKPRFNASTAVDLYGLQCIGVGAGLILNLPPSTSGIVEPSFVSWAGEFRTEWDRRFGAAAVVGTSNTTVSVATNLGAGNGAVTVDFARGENVVDYVIIREDLSKGQRVAGWVLEILEGTPQGTKVWQQVGAGSTIGAARIFPLGGAHGHFVPGEPSTSRASLMKDTFGVRFRPTISVAVRA
jgi:alpha-L-fucosidase